MAAFNFISKCSDLVSNTKTFLKMIAKCNGIDRNNSTFENKL